MTAPFKQSLRQLVLRPALSITVIAMLALGIGTATAIFSLFHQVLVQPLPVPEPGRLVNLAVAGPDASFRREAFSYPMFRDLEAGQETFTGIAAHVPFEASIRLDDGAMKAQAAFVSGGYFDVLDLTPAVGRLIGRRDEPQIGESAVVVLSHEMWRTRFGGDSSVVGRTLTINGEPLTVIGVGPEGFHGTRLGVRAHVFVPLTMRWQMLPVSGPDSPEERRFAWMMVFARLLPGVDAERATVSLNTLYGRILREIEAPLVQSEDDRRTLLAQQIELVPGARGQGSIQGGRESLVLLLGVTLLVLLIVCVNVANLLLVRGAARAGEMAIRKSIGASCGRLVAELLLESAVPAVIGGLLAIPVASVTLDAVAPILPSGLVEGLGMRLDSSAVVFAALATVASAVLFGAFPAFRTARTSPILAMKGQSVHALGGHSAPRVRAVLVTAQIAFSLALLVLAGLFARSLLNVARIDLGVDVDSLVVFAVSPPASGHDPAQTQLLYDRIEDKLAAQPGVADVAFAAVPLMAGFEFHGAFPIEPFDEAAEPAQAYFNIVDASFFQTLGIPVLAGRNFTPRDTEQKAKVAIANEAFARRYRLGDAAVGTGIDLDGRVEIVGVVADSVYSDVKDEVPPQIFLPRGSVFDEHPFSGLLGATFYVRSAVPESFLRTLPSVIAEVDPALPVDDPDTMRRRLHDQIFVDRLVTTLSVGFAALATVLAAVGLYAVMSYNVAARTRELGLRLALGAEPGNLRSMVMRQVAGMTAVGLAVGIVAAIGLGRAAEALLFELSGSDAGVLAGGVAFLAAVVLAASYIPARRAAAVAPMEALRHE